MGELYQDMTGPLEDSSAVHKTDHRPEEDLARATEGYCDRATMALRDVKPIGAGLPTERAPRRVLLMHGA